MNYSRSAGIIVTLWQLRGVLGGSHMTLRFFVALATCLVVATVLVGTAAADPPTRFEFSPSGRIACGDTILTVAGGMVVGREHVHELRSGRSRVILTAVSHNVTATDEEGTVYHLRGVETGSFTTPDPEAEGGEVGHFRFRLNIIGPDGLFGTVYFRIRGTRDGVQTFTDRGTCHFVD